MATPLVLGIGAIAAGLAGRHFLRRRAMGAAEQWVKGGFKAKMDRKEALAVLGLKCVISLASSSLSSLIPSNHFFSQGWPDTQAEIEGRAPPYHAL
jgi:hypothetical protein